MIFGTGFVSRYAFRYALIGMILTLCLSVSSWGACAEYTFNCGFAAYCGCGQGWGSQEPCDGTPELRGCQVFNNPNCPNASPQSCGNWYGTACNMNVTVINDTYVVTKIACDTQEEADSSGCVQDPDCLYQPPRQDAQGNIIPGRCVCDAPIDSTACEPYREECESMGGKFTGNPVSPDVSETGCLSFCDMCNSVAQNNYRRALANICCSQGKAPPAEITSCVNNALSGDPDMSFSNFDCDNQGGFDCDCQDVSSENADVYNSVCNENQWEEPNDGSGSDESSSSESSNPASSGSGEDWEYDYRDSLHKIKYYDSLTYETTRSILTCLTSPSICGSNSESSSPDYSGSLTDIKTDIKNLDTTVNKSINSLKGSISDGNDSLIDSMRRFISMNSFSFSGDTLGDSLGKIHSAVNSLQRVISDSLGKVHGAIDGVVNSLDSSIRSGYGSADTGSGNFPWISQGESQRDSILGGGPGGTGFGGLDFGADSAWMDSMENIGYTCDGDSCCIGDKCEYFESDSMIVDSLQRHAQRLGDSVRALNEAFYRDSVDNIFEEVKDSLKAFNPLHIFDSTLLSELGASIPNSNTCPEHCSTFQVQIPFLFGTQNYTIDWGLCMGRTAFAKGNVLSFLRFIIRIIVAVTCITAVMWNATRIRR